MSARLRISSRLFSSGDVGSCNGFEGVVGKERNGTEWNGIDGRGVHILGARMGSGDLAPVLGRGFVRLGRVVLCRGEKVGGLDGGREGVGYVAGDGGGGMMEWGGLEMGLGGCI